MNPWKPITKPIDLKHLGKLSEELGELSAAVSRCIIQGVDEREPTTGKSNRDWLTEEIADVFANCDLVIGHFDLNVSAIRARSVKKQKGLAIWHNMLDEADAKQSAQSERSALEQKPPAKFYLLKRSDLTFWGHLKGPTTEIWTWCVDALYAAKYDSLDDAQQAAKIFKLDPARVEVVQINAP